MLVQDKCVTQVELSELSDLLLSFKREKALASRLRDLVHGGCSCEKGRYAIRVDADTVIPWRQDTVAKCIGDREAKTIKALLPVRAVTYLILPVEDLWPLELEVIAELSWVSQHTIVQYLREFDRMRQAHLLRNGIKQRLHEGAAIEYGAFAPRLRTQKRVLWSANTVHAAIGADRFEELRRQMPTQVWRRLIITDLTTNQRLGWHSGDDDSLTPIEDVPAD